MTPYIKMPDIPAPSGTWDDWEVVAEPDDDKWRSECGVDDRAVRCLFLVARRKAKTTVHGWLTRGNDYGESPEFWSAAPFLPIGGPFWRIWDKATSLRIPEGCWPAPGCCCEYELEVDAVAGGPR